MLFSPCGLLSLFKMSFGAADLWEQERSVGWKVYLESGLVSVDVKDPLPAVTLLHSWTWVWVKSYLAYQNSN